MRQNQPLDLLWFDIERLKGGFPGILRGRGIQPGIQHAPAVAVAQQVAVDDVQGEGQRNAYLINPFGYGDSRFCIQHEFPFHVGEVIFSFSHHQIERLSATVAVYTLNPVGYNGHMDQPRMLHVPRPDQRTRLLTAVCGLIIFLWLSPEDNQVWPVTLIGVFLSLLVVSLTVFRRLGGRAIPARYVPLGALLLGGLTGLVASLSITLLMFFKNALHAHLFLDFPPGMLLAMLARVPGWAVAGGLVGLGISLVWLARERK
jgi:hypothetical protein